MKFIKSVSKPSDNDQMIVILDASKFKKSTFLDKSENEAVLAAIESKRPMIQFNSGLILKLVLPVYDTAGWELSEKLRKMGAKFCAILNEHKAKHACIVSFDKHLALAMSEGIMLSNYQFLKYFTDKKKRSNSLQNVHVLADTVEAKDLEYINAVIDSTYIARDLVNEPHSFLNAIQLSEEFKKIGK